MLEDREAVASDYRDIGHEFAGGLVGAFIEVVRTAEQRGSLTDELVDSLNVTLMKTAADAAEAMATAGAAPNEVGAFVHAFLERARQMFAGATDAALSRIGATSH